MKTAGLIIGILVILGMFVAFIPLLGWMNWGIIPVAIIGLVISIIATANTKEKKGQAIAGIVLCSIAILGGGLRLILGGGIL